MTVAAAVALVALLGALAAFQIALIAGAPLGRFAWGGQHERLPRNLRIASVSSLAIYALFAVLVLGRAGVVRVIDHESTLVIGMWIMTAYLFLGVLVNAISRSKPERRLMTPVAAVLALLSLAVASS